MSFVFLAPLHSRRFVDDPPGDPEQLAADVEPDETTLRRAVLAAVAEMLILLASEDTSAGVHNLLVAEMLRAFETVLTERGQPALAVAFTKGARFAFNRLPASVTVGYTFDLLNPEAALWAQLHAARMVTQVSDETRRAIRTIITRALTDGIAPRDVAKLIRPLIGLTERDALAVGNLQTRLIEEGRSDAAIERLVGRYAARLLRRRAENIARSEIMTAANAGQVELWRNALRDGLLVAGAWDKVWLVAKDDRLCPRCAPLGGARTAFPDGVFPGAGSHPPLHPSCRCCVALKLKRGAG